jgi:putative phosphoribosyl transferase
MFRNREEAGLRLTQRMHGRELRAPLVLAVPRGGIVIGAILAKELSAELNVVLARKLRAPGQPELAIGAISESGQVHLSRHAQDYPGLTSEYMVEEARTQMREINRRRQLFRDILPPAQPAERSVIVTDDGIATGATMVAALAVICHQKPHELIVAVPVASPDRLEEIREYCDEVICLLAPTHFMAIGQFYQDFTQVEDDEVTNLLTSKAPVDEPLKFDGPVPSP